jgi:hypothetical protein
MDNRYRLILECRRDVLFPAAGPQAYHSQYFRQDYTYGKNGVFKNSKDGVFELKNWINQFETRFSEITITVWNGNNGEVVKVFDDNNKFAFEMESFEFPVF